MGNGIRIRAATLDAGARITGEPQCNAEEPEEEELQVEWGAQCAANLNGDTILHPRLGGRWVNEGSSSQHGESQLWTAPMLQGCVIGRLPVGEGLMQCSGQIQSQAHSSIASVMLQLWSGLG